MPCAASWLLRTPPPAAGPRQGRPPRELLPRRWRRDVYWIEREQDVPFRRWIMRVRPRSETMIWETPTFVEVKMDAEINSYQDDFGDGRDTGV